MGAAGAKGMGVRRVDVCAGFCAWGTIAGIEGVGVSTGPRGVVGKFCVEMGADVGGIAGVAD